LKAKSLIYNACIYTQAHNLVVDSLAVYKNRIVALGNRLEHDPDFRSYSKINLRGRTVIPGFVDAHTHFYYFALSLGHVSLDGLDSLDACLAKIRKYAASLKRNEWVVGNGYAPDRFRKQVQSDRYKLDSVTGGRPAFIFFKDTHSAWVNSRALEIAGISKNTPDPQAGRIVRLGNGTPSGILREQSAWEPVFQQIKPPSNAEVNRRYGLALKHAYEKGVTGVHSMDGPEAFAYFEELAGKRKLGLRINCYLPAQMLPELHARKLTYGFGDDFLRVAGVKIFADGALGSRTALCFNRYSGSKDNFGVEVTPVDQMRRIIKSAVRLGLPCAIHAIGDKAVSNVLDALEKSPALRGGGRHRIEHLQLVRRKDIARVKRLSVVASTQPSHCPSDMHAVRKYWGKRGANAYIFRTLVDRGVDIAFGSDAPIEPLDPIAGIAAAVRRAWPKSRDIFYSEQRISAREALYRFTVGPAIASGQEDCRGYLLPGYPADFVVLDQDIGSVAPTKIHRTRVLATVLDGEFKYCHPSCPL